LLVAGEICALHAEPEKARPRMRGGMVCMGKRSEKSGPRGEGLGTQEDAVRGCAIDIRLEDFGTEEGAMGEDVVWGWEGIVKFRLESGPGRVCYPLVESMD
jgi:hypothetical protein